MSVRLGFADAVRRYGDRWRNAQFDAYRKGDDKLGGAFLMADGRVTEDYKESLYMRDYVTRDSVAISRAQLLGEVFSGKPMSALYLSNAKRHVEREHKGKWRTAATLKRCSHYFGDLACCKRAIARGQRYFDTEETVPDAGIFEPFVVCAPCARAPHCADFLKNRGAGP